jgi:non-ribosomal peptide synthase protein (TIGR01720 family)
LQRPAVQMSFTYLGQFDQTLDQGSLFRFATESTGPEVNVAEHRHHLLDVAGRIQGGRLSMMFYFSDTCHREESIARFALAFGENLEAIIEHCLAPDAGSWTTSDLAGKNITTDVLTDIYDEIFAKG